MNWKYENILLTRSHTIRGELGGVIWRVWGGGVGKRWSGEKVKGWGMVRASALWVVEPPSTARKPLVVWSAAAAGGGRVTKEVVGGGGTHWQPIVLHHFIKLLVNFFVFLLSAGGEGEGLLGVWALRVPVLFLVQSLRSPKKKKRADREGER